MLAALAWMRPGDTTRLLVARGTTQLLLKVRIGCQLSEAQYSAVTRAAGCASAGSIDSADVAMLQSLPPLFADAAVAWAPFWQKGVQIDIEAVWAEVPDIYPASELATASQQNMVVVDSLEAVVCVYLPGVWGLPPQGYQP